MQKRAPTLGNILVIILFVLSCFGLLMFLWESFGGPLPLKPKGYRFTVAFPRTLALAEQSDVRISGVNVGHVISLKLGSDGRTHATIEVAGKYAPIRANMHAILRQKTLLGETYVQLIPRGQTRASTCADGGQLAEQPGRTVGDARRHPLGVRPQDAQGLPDLAAGGRRRHQRARRTDQRGLRAARTVRAKTATSCVTLLNSQEGAVQSARAEHGRRVQRARQPRPPARRPDRQRRTHLPRRRRRQPGVRRGLPRAADVRAATRASRSKNSTSSPPTRARSSTNSARPSASCRCCSRRPSRSPRSSTGS